MELPSVLGPIASRTLWISFISRPGSFKGISLLDLSQSTGLFSAQLEAQILAAEFTPAMRGVKYGDKARRD
jgi:hypothetical protein